MEPNDAAAHCNLGEAYRALGELDEAIPCFRRAIGLKADYPEAHYNLGNALKSCGGIAEAVAEYQLAVQLRPNYVEAWNNLGVALAAKGQPEDAINAYRQALQILPDSVETYTNLGNALLNLERADEAVEAHRQAIAIKSDYPEALCNLGNALRNRGELHEAVAAYRRAVELRTDYFEAWNNLGVALLEQGQPDEAAGAFRRAIQLQPQSSDVHTNYGNAFSETAQFERAVAEHHQAPQNDNRTEAYSNLGNALKIQGRLDEAIAAYRQALVLDPEQPEVHSNLINTLHLHPHQGTEAVTAEQRAWNRQFCRLAGPTTDQHSNDRDPNRRLRIGYVSPDFRDHVVGRNLAPLFRNHDGQNFEFFCYSAVTKPDRLTEDFRGRASRWQNIVRVRDDVVAELIREDGVDILVDLSQHTASNRLPVFLSKPAPVQVSLRGIRRARGWRQSGIRSVIGGWKGMRIAECGMRNWTWVTREWKMEN